MNNWTVKKRVAVGFGLVILIVLALGGFALLRLGPINTSSNRIVSDCLPGVSAIGEWSSNLKENRALIQHYILTDAGGAKDKIASEIQQNLSAISVSSGEYAKTITQPEGQKLFAELQAARAPFDQAFGKVLELSGSGKGQEAMELFMSDLVPCYDKYLAAIVRQVKYNHDQALTASSQISSAVVSARNGILIGLFCAFGTALALAFVIITSTSRALLEIVAKLNKSTLEVESSSESVTASSMSFAEGASQQAASLEETSASLEEISSMTKRNAENALNSKTLSQQATQSASTGIERLTEMGRTLTSIKSAVGDMETAVSGMQNSSQEVAKIIKTIDEIAFQTNLLALNAAVEAARAGEAGMGFAVVADEVRALAQRSAQAAKDTSDKIESAIKRSEFGVTASANVVKNLAQVEDNAQNLEQVFNGIVTQIKSLDEVIGEISAASQEQSSGVGEVNMAVSQMDKVTQSNAAHAEENASAAAELHSQVGTLQTIVSSLKGIIDGSSAAESDAKLDEFQASPNVRSKPGSKPAKAAVQPGKPRGVTPSKVLKHASPDHEIPMPPAEDIADQSGGGGFKDF